MTLVEEHLNSIDAKLDAARAAWEAEKKGLQDQLLAAQLELKLSKEALDKAIAARSNAERTAATLVAQFGMVSQVFEEARELAIESGLYTKASSREDATEQAKAAIDRAISESKDHRISEHG